MNSLESDPAFRAFVESRRPSVRVIDLCYRPLDEMEERLDPAGTKAIFPFTIRHLQREPELLTVLDAAAWLKFHAHHLNLRAPLESVQETLCAIAFELVKRCNDLGRRGRLGLAPRKLSAWPINFAPGMSTEASRLVEERSLFEALGVGSDAPVRTRPNTRGGNQRLGKGGWIVETQLAVEAAQRNADYFPVFFRLRHVSKLLRIIRPEHPKTRRQVEFQEYETPHSRKLYWPSWLTSCASLPAKLRPESLSAYRKVVEALLHWHIFSAGGEMERLQTKVVDEDEGHPEELKKYDPDLAEKIFKGVRGTLSAMAGQGRRGASKRR